MLTEFSKGSGRPTRGGYRAVLDAVLCFKDKTVSSQGQIDPAMLPLFHGASNQILNYQQQNPLVGYGNANPAPVAGMSPLQAEGMGSIPALFNTPATDALALQAILRMPGAAGAGPVTGAENMTGMPSLDQLYSFLGTGQQQPFVPGSAPPFNPNTDSSVADLSNGGGTPGGHAPGAYPGPNGGPPPGAGGAGAGSHQPTGGSGSGPGNEPTGGTAGGRGPGGGTGTGVPRGDVPTVVDRRAPAPGTTFGAAMRGKAGAPDLWGTGSGSPDPSVAAAYGNGGRFSSDLGSRSQADLSKLGSLADIQALVGPDNSLSYGEGNSLSDNGTLVDKSSRANAYGHVQGEHGLSDLLKRAQSLGSWGRTSGLDPNTSSLDQMHDAFAQSKGFASFGDMMGAGRATAQAQLAAPRTQFGQVAPSWAAAAGPAGSAADRLAAQRAALAAMRTA